MSERWTIQRVLDWAVGDFAAKGFARPRFEAEVLLGHVLQVSRLVLYTHFDRPLLPEELAGFREAIRRRRAGECAAYITGAREFWSMPFKVTPDVLVPRPETETLVDAALACAAPNAAMLDLCCGSGCIAVALAKERPEAQVQASDISEAALAVAQENAETLLGAAGRVRFRQSDLLAGFAPEERFDIIVTNPPYVRGSEINALAPEVRGEPRLALEGGGADGLDIIRRILQDAGAHLHPNGHLFIELDPQQAHEVAQQAGPALLGATGRVITDLNGLARVVHFACGTP